MVYVEMNEMSILCGGCMKDKANTIIGPPVLHVASPSETSWNNPLLHFVLLPQGMGFFLSPLFYQRGTGMHFPLLRCKETLC